MFRLQSDDGEVACVAISDRVRLEDVSQAVDPLESLLGTSLYDRKMLLDLSGLKMLDSIGFCWLVQQNRRMRQSGGMLILHSASPQVSQTFHRLKMDLIFRIARDRESAIRLARSSDRDAATHGHMTLRQHFDK